MKKLTGLKFSFLLLVVATTFTSCNNQKQTLNVAVASNFEPYLRVIIDEFKSNKKPPYEINIISGASGLLSSQIINGAPFDLFLSADTKKPETIINSIQTLHTEIEVYAIGRLALWLPNGVDNNQCIEQLKDTRKISIANPDTAPYGLQALYILKKNKISEKKIINAANVNQAFIYTKESITEAGFVPYSSILLHQIKIGCIKTFDSSELNQGMLLLSDIAKPLFDFILSNEIQHYIQKSGYNVELKPNNFL